LRLVDALARRDGADLVAGVDALRALGLSAAATLEEMATLLQQMAVSQAVPGALDAQDPDTAEAVRLGAMMAPDETQLAYSIVLHGRNEIPLAPDEYSGLVMVLLRWLAFPPVSDAAAPAPPRPQRKVAAEPAPPPVQRPASGESPPWLDVAPDEGVEVARAAPAAQRAVSTEPVRALSPTPLGDRWDEHVRNLVEQGAVTAMARELALQSQCVAIDGNAWRLRVERESLRAPAQRERLQMALRQLLGKPVTLEVELGANDDTPARRDAAARERRQLEAEKTIEQDPLVQALMQQYRTARIVPGSVKPH
jgi:DNA polymerase-3 subunit gamma/tau